MSKYKFEEIAVNYTQKRIPTEEDQSLYIGLEHLDTGNLHVDRWGSSVPLKGEKLIMRKGDVLLGKRNAYLRRAAVAPHDGIFSAHGMGLQPREDVVDKDFFPLFIASDYFFDEAIRISVGSLSPTINWRDIRSVEFELPNMEKQRELAKVLWAMDATKRSYQHLLLKTDELVKAQFVEMFGKPGSDTKGWGLTTLGNCCELNPRRPRDMNDEVEYSFVAMPSVSEKGIIDTSILRPYSEICKGFTYFAENDVLFAKITPCMENGKGGVAEGLKNGAGFGSTEFHVLRPIIGKSNPYWLYIITMFSKFRCDAEKVMTGTGGQRRVPIAYLDQYPISLPPIKLQEQFENFVRQSNKSKLQLEQTLEELIAAYKKIISENLG